MVNGKKRKHLGQLSMATLALQMFLSCSTVQSISAMESFSTTTDSSSITRDTSVEEGVYGAAPLSATDLQSEFIASNLMRVEVDKNFPSVIQYQYGNAVMYGQEDRISQVKINGISYTPNVTFSNMGSKASYTLTFPTIDVTMTIVLEVAQNTLNFNVTGITETGATKVKTFEIPNHNLLSVRSTQSGATFAGSRMYTAVAGTGDTVRDVTGTPQADASPQNYLYTFLNTSELAGGIWTNAISDYTTDTDNERLHKQTVNKAGYALTGIWSGSWLYRPEGMNEAEPLPSAKVVITGDANKDSAIDWQDAAIAYRSIMETPQGSDRIPDLVVQRIPFNFASQATNPFLKTLDETKRIYLNTDGLGQFIELKGYQQEGHDSAHPDYGNNIGIRQGGATDMNTLVNVGHQYGGYFGVHINATEAYPEAKYFSDTLVDPNKPGWDWLDASFLYNKAQMRSEASTAARFNRLQELKTAVPNLDFIYADTWFENGWNGARLAREMKQLGWAAATEFPTVMEKDAIWYHWATEYNYGGTTVKGFNSQIARFIHNHQKDTWIVRNPLLGGTELEAYEGWVGKVNYDNMIKMTFATNLPTKYMQHFPITKWTGNTVNFENNVSVSNAGGTRVMTKDGITILNGGAYLLPWNPKTEEKLYHWNANGGNTSWTLPLSWSGLTTVKLYKLTDQGKEWVQDLTVSNNQITINAVANTPYVVYKGDAPAAPDLNYGEGSLVKDSGFNSGGLAAWTVTGDTASAAVQRNSRGQYELKMASGGEVSVSQKLTGLSQGTYSAYVNVEVEGTRRAVIGVKDYGGDEVTNYTGSSFASNYIAADAKNGTNMQRMRVLFDVPAGQTTATLYLKGQAGTTNITFDDVHLLKIERAANPTNAYFAEDFEHVDAGWYPFVKAEAGGINDPRTHLSELHAPYTQKGWNGSPIDHTISGNWSLVSHKENRGLVYKTLPQTLRFTPGTTYTVSFKYESGSTDYAFVVGDGVTTASTTTFHAATSPETFKYAFVASSSGNSWIGLKKKTGNDTDFVMDDLVVSVGGDVSQNPPPDSGLVVDPNQIPQSQMTATATSEELENEANGASNVLDGDPDTIWHTKWDKSDPLPQSITLNLGGTYDVNKIKVLPRQGGGSNGIITAYNVYASTDGVQYTKVSSGTWAKDATEKTAEFPVTRASFIKLEATAGYNGWASAAEINVYRMIEVPVTGVQLDKPQVSLKEGQTAELVATVLPENATNKNVTWASSDNTVAKVEVKDGKTVVTALKAGAADITVTTVGSNFTAVSHITVQKGDSTQNALTTLSAAGTVTAGGEFPVQLGLSSVTQSVYALDIKLDYDSNVFDFVSARAVKDGVLLVDTVKDTLGKLRFILASLGKAVTGDSGILELKFKAKAVTQPATGTIAVTDAALGDAQGAETKAQASTVGVIIATQPPGMPGDVTHDNKISIGDLGIVAANYGKTSSSPDWEQVKQADVTGDGKIDIEDLAFVAKKIME
ncbi:endo-alpha-N-acetylgalactosaminidase family protein [Paenibacillus aceris]|uniref:Endo-alpha-N-acetylgalactosaminidase n=5 Tax=Paenibacillus aceris TaxID=869555 RepID=A0ABS4HUH8_9BACL|nr:endo-alpha-N-acetylgalactosaminidase family protein [Paenibacillus aceris]MBP1962262.1 endo-alpha-N-acetylgalactosaminidase [Paenibacillus aceris]